MGKLRRLLRERLRHVVLPHAALSYSQEGEDLILQRLFGGRATGFYVDVGAHHPMRFSNTYRFYRRGWRGLNIDAMPGSMAAFRRHRPRDINVELGIASERKALPYFIFNDPALNTFDPVLAESRKRGGFWVVKREDVQTDTLSSVLNTYLPTGQAIDFMSIDVEGFDLIVLESNDWSRFRPSCICVEHSVYDLFELPATKLYQLLAAQGYVLHAKTVGTLFFARPPSS